MKKLKLNIKNLYKVGLTPEICKNNFEEWITKNEGFYVDFNNEIIYYGKSNLKNELKNTLEFVKNELIEKGISLEALDSKIQIKNNNMKNRLDAVLTNIPEDMKIENLLNTMYEKNKKMKSLRDKIISDKIDKALNSCDEEKINLETDKLATKDNLESNNIPNPRISDDKNTKKYPAKYQALAYILELLAEGKKPPEDFEGNFKKDEIIKIGRERCYDSGQNFYNIVKDNFNFVLSKNIKYLVFKNNWKEIILEITINKKEVELFIKDNNL